MFGFKSVIKSLNTQCTKLQKVITDREEDVIEIDSKIEDLMEDKNIYIIERDLAKKILNDLKKYIKKENKNG